MSAIARLALLPRDGVFSKDARGWFAGESGKGRALDWPWPSALLGVVRGAWGRAHESRRGRAMVGDEWRAQTAAIVLRQTLMLRRPFGAAWRPEHRVWPVPADAFWPSADRASGGAGGDGGSVSPLLPRPIEVVNTLASGEHDGACERLWRAPSEGRAKPGARPAWWRDGDFVAWLAGGDVPRRDASEWLTLERRTQTHVSIRRETMTAEEGLLFTHDVLEPLVYRRRRGGAQAGDFARGVAGASTEALEWAMGVEVRVPEGGPRLDGLSPPVAHFGSNGRAATLEALSPELFSAPPLLREAFRRGSRGLRLVVVNAACFKGGWLPDGFRLEGGELRGHLPKVDAELVLRAAMVARPIHASGWDMVANQPKPIARLVSPGAVYFFERVDRRPFDESNAEALWLAPLGGRTDEGFGRMVPGVWSALPGEKT
ncbi:MAG: hypothetical protein MUF34_14450 [Polyangiaceae bacterium]|nr:hypothetical protein [Polyangiaceae bacterium]